MDKISENEFTDRSFNERFSLVELLCVVVMFVILAPIIRSQYFRIVERRRLAQALGGIEPFRVAEERYLSLAGSYCTGDVSACAGLDERIPSLEYFNVLAVVAGSGKPSWKMTLARNADIPIYARYRVTYDVEPGESPRISCSQLDCSLDLLP